ncbi:MAG: hypothetical protein ABJN62_03200 [Halioglobus sp.]
MQKMLARLLIAFLLMPSLVCAMPFCPTNTEAPASAEQSTKQQSHCGSARDKDTEKAAPKVMLFVDCTGVDLQASSLLLQINEPQFSNDLTDYEDSDLWQINLGDEARFNTVRAPPKPQNNFNRQTPLYLKTQRIRL